MIDNRSSLLSVLPLAIFAIVGLGCSSKEDDTSNAEHATDLRDRLLTSDELTARPLISAHGGPGPLFEMLSSRTTGVDFVNALHPENNVPYIYMGAGVATADYDQDGRPDVYLMSVDGANKLYRQIGDFQFQDVTDVAGVNGGNAWSRGSTFFDVDNDGDLDLYVCNTEAPNLLYVNQGDGTFVEAAKEHGIDFVGASVMAGVADYDRDGDLDLYVVTHRPLHYSVKGKLLDQLRVPSDTRKTRSELECDYRFQTVNGQKIPLSRDDVFENLNHWELAGQSDALFRNNGNGTFTDVTEAAGLHDHGLGLSSTWLDFDGDGWLDLHVANDLQTKDRLYRNNADGTFTLATQTHLPHTTWYSMGADFGDINNDGLLDFLVVDMASTTHYRSKLQMGDMGQFRYFMEAEWPPQLMRNALYLNTGSRRYMEIAKLSGLDASDWTWAVKLADLDNDGWVDAYFTNGIARADEMNPDLKSEISSIMRQEGADAVARIVKSQGEDATANLVFRNQGNLSFEEVGATWGLNLKGISYGAANVDLDGDGDLDLVVNNHNGPATIYRNQSDQGHRAVFHLRGVVSNRFGIGAKVTLESAAGIQMRQLFPVHGYMTSDEPIVHFGLGSDERIAQVAIDWPSGHRQVFENLPVDHAFIVTEPNAEPAAPRPPAPSRTQFVDITATSGLAFKHQEFPYNDFGVQPLLPGKLSQLGPGLAWGDCDNDGDEDLFIGGAAGQPGALFKNLGHGDFAQMPDGVWLNDALCEDMAPLWVDVDSDDDLDLVVSSGSSEYDPGDERLENRLYLNDGQGVFQTAEPDALPARAGSSSAVVAADFDQDGDLDLFVGERFISGQYPLAPNCQLLRNDKGQFHDVTDELAPSLRKVGLVTSALWSDADDDGQIDLLVAVEWGPIRFFRNEAGHLVERTEAAGLAERSGWWNSLASGDVDADGDIDYVALNAGLNTKYGSPTAQKPQLLYYGDMDNSGEMNLVEVKSHDSGLLPVRGLSCSAGAMPVLGERFTTFHSFASSMLTDIYAPQRLEAAHRFVANELASGLLINNGDAHFEWRPLPKIAQAAPGYGASVRDLDGDGYVDIYFVQNLFSREPETGAWDGGLSILLRGDGAGGFQPVSPAESGLIVTGDAKGMAIADIDGDGWPDIVAAQNDDSARVFRNQGIDGRRSIAMRLRGVAGNRHAVGARVTIRLRDNRHRAAEIHAGSGYLSQSAPCVFLGEDVEDVDVRWPDGTRTTHSLQGTEKQVIIDHPVLSGQ